MLLDTVWTITAPVAIIHCQNLLFFHDNDDGVATPCLDMEKATNPAVTCAQILLVQLCVGDVMSF
jgi:hypothetical protein